MASIAGLAPQAAPPQQQYRGPPPLGPFSTSKLHSDPERFICIYPAYLNKAKSLSEGRRIPKEKAVENPNFQEIRLALDEAGYEMGKSYMMEGKYYCRERSKEQHFRGRFKVQLKQADGELLKEEFPTRESIMLMIAEKIPQQKLRLNPPKAGAAPEQQGSGGAKPKQGKKKGGR